MIRVDLRVVSGYDFPALGCQKPDEYDDPARFEWEYSGDSDHWTISDPSLSLPDDRKYGYDQYWDLEARACRCRSTLALPTSVLYQYRGQFVGFASSSSTSSAVDGAPLGVFLMTGNSSLSNKISPSCLGEDKLNGWPASSQAFVSSS